MTITDRRKIFHVNLLPPGEGGIEKLLIGFYKSFDREKYEISLCSLSGESETSKALQDEGCKFFALHRREDKFSWDLYSKLVKVFKQEQPHVIHIHGTSPLLFAVPAAKWVNHRNLVYTCHTSRPNPSRKIRLAFKHLLKRVAKKVVVSQAAGKMLSEHYGVPETDWQLIYNGVNLSTFGERVPGLKKEKITIGFCGVFRPEKQLPVLIKAFHQSYLRNTDIHLLMVGDGPDMSVCRQMVEQLGLETQVTFTGMQREIRPFLERMDIGVLPSEGEAMPVSVIEEMATGMPVIGSNVRGIHEIVEHECNGLLVDSGSAKQLSEAISLLVESPDLRVEYGMQARQTVERKFSERQMIESYSAIYDSFVTTPKNTEPNHSRNRHQQPIPN